PYLDIALAGAGLAAATIASGGTLTIPVAIAATATLATAAAAADQITINTTGTALVSDSVRTALDITALAGGITGGLIGAKKAPQAAHKIGNALKSKFRSAAPKTTAEFEINEYRTRNSMPEAFGMRSAPIYKAKANPKGPTVQVTQKWSTASNPVPKSVMWNQDEIDVLTLPAAGLPQNVLLSTKAPGGQRWVTVGRDEAIDACKELGSEILFTLR
ncbi:hypothetical protein, partial [Streptomyces cyaneofuscatus]|uniref:hypothetical protein n=1 Tax=Streptomyces cyaneofuscatus TaxID=66883 RepID=UPI00365F3749